MAVSLAQGRPVPEYTYPATGDLDSLVVNPEDVDAETIELIGKV